MMMTFSQNPNFAVTFDWISVVSAEYQRFKAWKELLGAQGV